MGRLIYVREDREAEPRFGPPGGAARGGFAGPMGAGAPYGGGGGGFNPGMAAGGGGRQIYISNVCYILSSTVLPCHLKCCPRLTLE
jgi:hypothetical protein